MKLKSGELAPKAGAFKEINQKGDIVNTVHVKKGDKMPPTQCSSCHYEID